tara:strand:- start:2225 stop:2947 length:723 start_codon:yes stop_codon:yes gene_type:complete
MKAIILAAGRGRRFTKDHSIDHKSLLKINNLSLIERQIKILQKYGIVEIWVVIGHNSVKIKEEIKKYNVNFLYNKNYKKTDTLESFSIAKHVIDDELITLYADVIFEEKIINNILNQKDDDIVLSIEKSDTDKDDMKTYVENNFVKKIDKHLSSSDSNSKYVGIAKFSKNGSKIFKDFLEKFMELNSLEGDVSRVFEEIIDKNHPIFANFIGNLLCVNVNTHTLFKKAEKYFQNKSSNTF